MDKLDWISKGMETENRRLAVALAEADRLKAEVAHLKAEIDRLQTDARKEVGQELSALARDLRDDPLAGLLPFALSDIGSRLEAGMPAIYDPVIIEHKEVPRE